MKQLESQHRFWNEFCVEITRIVAIFVVITLTRL